MFDGIVGSRNTDEVTVNTSQSSSTIEETTEAATFQVAETEPRTIKPRGGGDNWQITSKTVCDDGYKLGYWINNCKVKFRKGKLADKYAVRFEKFGIRLDKERWNI